MSLHGQVWLEFLERLEYFSHGIPSTSIIVRTIGIISVNLLSKLSINRIKIIKGQIFAIFGNKVRYFSDYSSKLGMIRVVNALSLK